MGSTTAAYVLYFLACYLTPVSAQTRLQLSMTDYYGTATTRFDHQDFVEFYNCLCSSNTKTCNVFANNRNDVYTQSKISGPEENFFQYECSKLLGRNDFQCTRLSLASASCRNEERCWTFHVSPRETKCNFRGSIGIVWNQVWQADYESQHMSINNCIYGCDGSIVTTPSTTTTPRTNTRVSVQKANTSVSVAGLTGATTEARQDYGPEDGQSKLIVGVVVGILLALVIVILVIGIIFFQKRRASSKSREKSVVHMYPAFTSSSSTYNNIAQRSPHSESSILGGSPKVFDTHQGLNSTYIPAVSNLSEKIEKSGIVIIKCNGDDTRKVNDPPTLPLFEDVEYYNVSRQVQHSLQPSTNEKDNVEYFNVGCDTKQEDSSCFKHFSCESEQDFSQNFSSTESYRVDIDVITTKPDVSNREDTNKELRNNNTKTAVYTAVNKVKRKPEQYATLHETMRKMTNPYNLLADPSQDDDKKHNFSDETSAEHQTKYFEAELPQSSGLDIENRLHVLPHSYLAAEEVNLYEADPYSQGIDDDYSEVE